VKAIKAVLGTDGPALVLSESRKQAEAALEQLKAALADWGELSDSGLRLRCGELTSQEIRTVRAVLNAILANNPVTHGRAQP